MIVASATRADLGSRVVSWLPPFVLCGAAALFAWCVAAGPQLYDSGELAAAAVGLGGSHPPGQTLHALIGHAFTWLPLGGIPARLALLSAGCALVAAWIAGQLCAELCAELGAVGPWRSASEAATILAVLVAQPVLRQSLRIEVYTLALALYLASALQLFRWARDARGAFLWSAAVLAGLAACVHPPHALATVLTAASCFVLQPRRLLPSTRSVLFAIGAGVLPLLTLCYLPVRAHAGADMWGDPQTFAGFVRYVSGEAFLANIASQNRFELIRDYGAYLLQLNSGVPFIGALLLFSPRVGAGKRAVLGLVLASFVALLSACLQPLETRNPDNVAYLAPALVLAAVTGVAGWTALGHQGRRVLAVLGLCLVAIPPASVSGLGAQLRADVPALETLSGMLVEAPPPRALVVVTSDFAAASLMAARSVERARPDIGLFITGLSTSSWHWAQLAKHPGLDPRPRRAEGRSARDRYTRGAVLAALPRVSVALERDLEGLRTNGVAGPYLLIEPRGVAGAARHLDRSMGERFIDTLARDVRSGPPGDTGAAFAVVREVLYRRSQHLFQLGRGQEALAGVALALWQLPLPERALVWAQRDAAGADLPFIVDDTASYMTSLEDAVREAAAELWGLSEREPALRLLQRQLERGDPFALLQLAYLRAFDGDREGALGALDGFDARAPALRAQSAALRAQLTR